MAVARADAPADSPPAPTAPAWLFAERGYNRTLHARTVGLLPSNGKVDSPRYLLTVLKNLWQSDWCRNCWQPRTCATFARSSANFAKFWGATRTGDTTVPRGWPSKQCCAGQQALAQGCGPRRWRGRGSCPRPSLLFPSHPLLVPHRGSLPVPLSAPAALLAGRRGRPPGLPVFLSSFYPLPTFHLVLSCCCPWNTSRLCRQMSQGSVN